MALAAILAMTSSSIAPVPMPSKLGSF